ncbi:MAG: SpoIIIAH-like family protein [Bacilli bacterium]|nr:SpoIIIAH-like family protein [Bacilli bacterium]
MINKKSIWFVTLFTLILVLSVYYVTMPSELLLSNGSNYTKKTTEKKETETKETALEVEESEILTSLRVESDEKVEEKMDKLKATIANADASADDKNNAYDEMKSLNQTRGIEEDLEKVVLEQFKLKSFIKIDGDQIKVVVLGKEHNTKVANNIMRAVQAKQSKKMYISVQFKNA